MTTVRHPSSALCAALLGVALLTGCGGAAERIEVLRVPSPDAALDAVVVQSSAGATTSFGYFVFLPPHGCAVPSSPVLRVVDSSLNPRASGVHLDWTGPRTVVVSYLDARFTDPDSGAATTDTVAGPVTVTTRPGSPDPAAAPGGMPPRPGPLPLC